MGNEGSKKSTEDIIREQKLAITRQCRSLDRERQKLEREEKKMTQEIKTLAKKNQTGPVKTLARGVVRTRAQINKFYEVRGELQALSSRLSTMKSTETMNQALKEAGQAIMLLDKKVNLGELTNTVKEFGIANERMEAKQEMMNEAMDMAMSGENEEAETDQLANQLLDEIGVTVAGSMQNAPSAQLQHQNMEEEKVGYNDMEARLNALRN